MSERNRKGSAVIFILALLAAVMIITGSALRSVHRSGRSLRTLEELGVARENARAGLEHAKAEVYRRRGSGKEFTAEGFQLEGDDWSASVRPLERDGEYELTATGRCGGEEEAVGIHLAVQVRGNSE